MTGLTVGYAEAVACATPGTAYTDSTTATIISPEQASLYIPPNWWNLNKGLHFHARGIVSAPSSSGAALTLGVASDTTQGTVGTPKWTNGSTVTPANSASSWPWEMEGELICNSVSGANAEVVGLGELTMPGSASVMSTPNVWGSTTAVAVPIASPSFLEIYALWASAVSGSSVTFESVFWVTT